MGNKHIILYLSQKGATNDKMKWTRPNLIKTYFCALRCLENIEKHTQKRQQSKQFWKMLQHFWQTLTLALIKVRSLLEHSCSILISFKIVVIFNTTSADIKTKSADVKVINSEKATKIYKISALDFTVITYHKSTVDNSGAPPARRARPSQVRPL